MKLTGNNWLYFHLFVVPGFVRKWWFIYQAVKCCILIYF